MSYTLEFYFEPAVAWRRLQRYFAERDYFSIAGREVIYENPVTEISFSIDFCLARKLLGSSVVSGTFTIKYFRPSYFGIEAEIELSAFIAAFAPRIHDSQMRGMGDGPYSGAGFLKGWDFGNRFSIETIRTSKPGLKIASMPGETLRAIWAWNYAVAARNKRFGDRRFAPSIMFYAIDGIPASAVVWPLGMPVSLPKVDYVLVGRLVSGEMRFGLASWPDVAKQLRFAGFDTSTDPIEVEYFDTPKLIEQWIAEVPEIDVTDLAQLPPHVIIDAELLETTKT